MLYLVRFPDGWFKVGYTSTDIWSRASLFWTNKHPPDLCGRLGPDDVQVEALFGGSLADEQTVFAEFPPQCGEFYCEATQGLGKVLGFMLSKFDSLPIPARPEGLPTQSVEKLPCCGGVEYTCFTCGAKFNRGIKLKQHLDDVHRKIKAKCCKCGLGVIQRNLKRHQGTCKKN
jgi:DNA-directed RNA polymerase subunit RPC12/RpoP